MSAGYCGPLCLHVRERERVCERESVFTFVCVFSRVLGNAECIMLKRLLTHYQHCYYVVPYWMQCAMAVP